MTVKNTVAWKLGICMIISAILFTGCQNNSKLAMTERSDTEQSDTKNTHDKEQYQNYNKPITALPIYNTIIYQGNVLATSKDLIICKSPVDGYSIYATQSGSVDHRLYTKINLSLPSEMQYDSWKLIPMIRGGSGVVVEITRKSEKSYYIFEPNLSDFNSAKLESCGDWQNFIFIGEIPKDEITELLLKVGDTPLSALPANETVLFQGSVAYTEKKLVICESDDGLYSVYATQSGNDGDKAYAKMYPMIPTNLKYDSWRLLPLIRGRGEVVAEFTSNGIKSYYSFAVNISDFNYAKLDEEGKWQLLSFKGEIPADVVAQALDLAINGPPSSLPDGEKVIYRGGFIGDHATLVLCKSAADRYSVYAAISDISGRDSYIKMRLNIPEDMEYDSWELLPFVYINESIVIKFTANGENSYYLFDPNATDYDSDNHYTGEWQDFYIGAEKTEKEISRILDRIDKGPLYELPSDESILFKGHLNVTSYDLIICESPSEGYAIYVTNNHIKNKRTYIKMDIDIPDEIQYDSWRPLFYAGGTGGSGGAGVILEFTLGGEKSYYGFETSTYGDDVYGWQSFKGAYKLDKDDEFLASLLNQ
ncbi:MAG: hypothetical protein VB118_10025 [Oscillospiraceae bacterium]|nr:hypothetical protein [Oscillospiraceae bacterium]